MTIDRPSPSQEEQLRLLWQEAFGDTEQFLSIFYSTAFSTDRCRCAVVDGALAGALYWFDCIHDGRRIAYIYAVATAKAFRGRGVCHALMEDTHRHLEELGYAGTILVPGSERLFRLYEGMGYGTCSAVAEFTCTPAEKAGQIRPVAAAEYAALRRQLLPPGGVVQEGENLAFLAAQAALYAGPGFLLAARREGEGLTGLELLGDAAAAPGILKTLGCNEGTFRAPGKEKPFAMYRPLTAAAPPTYFGLAFD